MRKFPRTKFQNGRKAFKFSQIYARILIFEQKATKFKVKMQKCAKICYRNNVINPLINYIFDFKIYSR